MLGPWVKLTIKTGLLGLEVSSLIGLRLSQIAVGQGTSAEGQLMITENILAFIDTATTVAAGGSAHDHRGLSKARPSQCRAPASGLRNKPPTSC
jgi:hypothetical protein